MADERNPQGEEEVVGRSDEHDDDFEDVDEIEEDADEQNDAEDLDA